MDWSQTSRHCSEPRGITSSAGTPFRLGCIVSKAKPALNAAPIVHWNLDKHYLQDLEQRVSRWSPPPHPTPIFSSLFELMAQRGWSDVVIKPAIAGAAVDTYHVTRPARWPPCLLNPHPPGTRIALAWLLAKQDMLVQPFPSRDRVGKILIWIDGEGPTGSQARNRETSGSKTTTAEPSPFDANGQGWRRRS